jgi:hypothetical protein
MAIQHDPARQIDYLQQCLSQDKRSIGFLLAAGCPFSIRIPAGTGSEPLIPDVRGLTDLVAKELTSSGANATFRRVQEHLKTDGTKDPNVENYLSFVRGLKAIAGGGAVRDLKASDLSTMEEEICKIITDRVNRDLPTTDNPYSQLAVWIASTERSAAVEIFTTNYDLLAEQALERFRVPYFDGFSGSREAFLDAHTIDNDQLPNRWARIWKLHGSINWILNPEGRVCRIATTDGKHLIHPSHLKFDESRRMPYLAMVDRLKAFLRRPSSILVIAGYSFRDDHINACILEGLTGSPRSAVFALLFGNLADHPEATKLGSSVGNLSILAADGGVIGAKRGLWDSKDHSASGDWDSLISHTPATSGTPALNAFHLGDFQKFGSFLATLTGTHAEDATDAK